MAKVAWYEREELRSLVRGSLNALRTVGGMLGLIAGLAVAYAVHLIAHI
jgi:uncharacterized protein YjeT (DUF2065 family)